MVRVSPPAPVVLAVLASILVVTAAVPLGAARMTAGTTPGPGSLGTPAGGVVAQQASNASNNTTTRQHANPDAVSGSGDLGALKRWLARNVGTELESCTQTLGLGEANVCEMSDAYPEWVSKYVDVAEETDAGADDSVGRAFEESRAGTRDLTEDVSTYEETYAAYQEARANGNEQRARVLARELRRLARQIEATGQSVVGEYGVITNRTQANLSDAADRVNETVDSVTERTGDVLAVAFVETRLVIPEPPRRFSFAAPLELSGRLETANGTPIPERAISLEVGQRTMVVRTNATGGFTLTYRPVRLPANATTLQVTFRPRNRSRYAATTTDLNVTVGTVTPELTAALSPGTAAFNETVSVEGTAVVDGRAVPRLPLVVVADGTVLGRTVTAGNGSYQFTGRLPASVRPGDQTVRVRVALRGRAVGQANASTSMRVESTPTGLSVAASQAGSQLAVNGTLQTTGGGGVPGQQVVVAVNGSVVGTLPTGPGGTFSGRVAIPAGIQASASAVTVTVGFDGVGTNLGPSEATTRVAVQWESAGTDDTPGVLERLRDSTGGLLVLLAGVILLVLAGGYVLWRERGPSSERRPTETPESPPVAAADPVDEAESPAASHLDRARDALESGNPEEAVVLAYAGTRADLDTHVEADGTRATHWEFLESLRASQQQLADGVVAAMTELTEAYERAAYAAADVSPAEAESVLDLVAGERDDAPSGIQDGQGHGSDD